MREGGTEGGKVDSKRVYSRRKVIGNRRNWRKMGGSSRFLGEILEAEWGREGRREGVSEANFIVSEFIVGER